MHPIVLQQIQSVYRSGLNIGIGDLQNNSDHNKIRESLLGSAGVYMFPGLSNWCTFGFSNQLSGRYIPATELDLIWFRPFPLGELVWHLSTQVNDGDISS